MLSPASGAADPMNSNHIIHDPSRGARLFVILLLPIPASLFLKWPLSLLSIPRSRLPEASLHARTGHLAHAET